MKVSGTSPLTTTRVTTISTLAKPIAVLTISVLITLVFIFTSTPSPKSGPNPSQMSTGRSFILWLHGLGDSGPANEPIKNYFKSPQFNSSKWFFPSAPPNPVTCNHGAIMPSWFDIPEIPVTAWNSCDSFACRLVPCEHSPNDETSVLKAVKHVHAMIDEEINTGVSPDNIFVCGFSQGGALTLASVLLYPKTLGGGAIFSGWVPFNHSMIEQFPADAKKTPILWSHGLSDPTILFEAGQEGPPFLEKAGVTCEFKAYPGLGHSINAEELKNLESWIKSRFSSSS